MRCLVRSFCQRCVVSSVNLGKVTYMLERKAGVLPEQVEQTFAALGVTVADLTVDHVPAWPRLLKTIDASSRAAQTAAGVTKATSLSLADLACLASPRNANYPC